VITDELARKDTELSQSGHEELFAHNGYQRISRLYARGRLRSRFDGNGGSFGPRTYLRRGIRQKLDFSVARREPDAQRTHH